MNHWADKLPRYPRLYPKHNVIKDGRTKVRDQSFFVLNVKFRSCWSINQTPAWQFLNKISYEKQQGVKAVTNSQKEKIQRYILLSTVWILSSGICKVDSWGRLGCCFKGSPGMEFCLPSSRPRNAAILIQTCIFSHTFAVLVKTSLDNLYILTDQISNADKSD